MDERIRNSVARLTNRDLEESNSKYQGYDLSETDVFERSKRNGYTRKRKLAEDDDDDHDPESLIGIRRGGQSFKVDPLYDKWRTGTVPREDGMEWPEGTEGEGGYYEKDWRTEEEDRREILERNKNYQFIYLVAGAANTSVEQLYEDGDIAAIYRREQALLRQQRVAIEQARITLKELDLDVKNLAIELTQLKSRHNVYTSAIKEADRYIFALKHESETYEEEHSFLMHLEREKELVKIYQKRALAVVTSAAYAEVKDLIILEAEYLLINAESRTILDEEEKRITAEMRDLLTDIETDDALKELVKLIIDYWFYLDDREKYNTYVKQKDDFPSKAEETKAEYLDQLYSDHHERKITVLKVAVATPVLTDNILRNIKETLLAEGNFILLDKPHSTDQQSIYDAIDKAIDKVNEDEPGALIELTQQIIDYWFLKDDAISFSRYSKYIRDGDVPAARTEKKNYEIVQLIKEENKENYLINEIRKQKEKVADQELVVLQHFYPVIFFIHEKNILSIDESDIYTVVLVGVPPKTTKVAKDFDPYVFKLLYIKYGGTIFGLPLGGRIDIRDLFTTEFLKIYDEIVEIITKDPTSEFSKTFERLGPYVKELVVYREWIKIKETELSAEIQEVEEQLDASQKRLSLMRRGEITFKDLPQPYRHRRRWVEAPEHSGIVRLKPIVVTAIENAFGFVQQWTPYGKKVDVEFMQHDTEIRKEFANLVAQKMSAVFMLFPKQYVQFRELRKFSKMQEVDIGNKLIHGFEITSGYDEKGERIFIARTRTQSKRESDFGNSMLRDKREIIIFN